VAGVEPISEIMSKLRMTRAFVKRANVAGDLAFSDSRQKAAVSSTDMVSGEGNGS